MHLPDFMRRVNRVFTNPLFSAIAWIIPTHGIVHHVGRKSGRPYRSPVVVFRCADGFVIPMVYGRDVDWGRNLMAANGGELVHIGRRFQFRNPRIVDVAIAYPLIPPLVRNVFRWLDFPGYMLIDTAPEAMPA